MLLRPLRIGEALQNFIQHVQILDSLAPSSSSMHPKCGALNNTQGLRFGLEYIEDARVVNPKNGDANLEKASLAR